MATAHGYAPLREGPSEDTSREIATFRLGFWTPLPQPGAHLCEEPVLTPRISQSSPTERKETNSDAASAAADCALVPLELDVAALPVGSMGVAWQEKHWWHSPQSPVSTPPSPWAKDAAPLLLRSPGTPPTRCVAEVDCQMPDVPADRSHEEAPLPVGELRHPAKCSEGPLCPDTEAETTASATHDASDSSEEASAAAESADEGCFRQTGRPENLATDDDDDGSSGIPPLRGYVAGLPPSHPRRSQRHSNRRMPARPLPPGAFPELEPKSLGPPCSPRAPFCAAQGLYASDDFIWSDLDVNSAVIVSESSFDPSAPFGSPVEGAAPEVLPKEKSSSTVPVDDDIVFGPPRPSASPTRSPHSFFRGCNGFVMREKSSATNCGGLGQQFGASRPTMGTLPSRPGQQRPPRLANAGVTEVPLRENTPSAASLPDESGRCAGKTAVFSPHGGGLCNLAEQLATLATHRRPRAVSQSARSSVPPVRAAVTQPQKAVAVRPSAAPPPSGYKCAEAQELADRVVGFRRAASASNLKNCSAPLTHQQAPSPFERIADAWQGTAEHILQAVHIYTSPCETKVKGAVCG